MSLLESSRLSKLLIDLTCIAHFLSSIRKATAGRHPKGRPHLTEKYNWGCIPPCSTSMGSRAHQHHCALLDEDGAGLLPDSVENTLTRAHGKPEVVSLLQKMKKLDALHAEKVKIRCACQENDGALEHWNEE